MLQQLSVLGSTDIVQCQLLCFPVLLFYTKHSSLILQQDAKPGQFVTPRSHVPQLKGARLERATDHVADTSGGDVAGQAAATGLAGLGHVRRQGDVLWPEASLEPAGTAEPHH